MPEVFHTPLASPARGASAARTTPIQKLCIAAVVGALGIWGTCALGFWQVRRAAAKEVLLAQLDAAAHAAPAFPDASALARPATLVHRHLRLQGRWLADRVVYLDNRPHAGQAGFYVLMPLRLDAPLAGDVIVNRGWTPRNREDRARIGTYETPVGPVALTGVALAEEPRLLDLAEPPSRALPGIWQNFAFDAYAAAAGEPALPIVVRQDSGGADGLARDWPDRGDALQGQIDRHHGYAFQWFALAATLAALLLLQVFRVFRHGHPRISPR